MRRLQLERVPLHLADRRPHGRVDVGGRAARPVDPHPQVELGRRVEVSARDGLVLGRAVRAHRLRPLEARQPGPDEDERAHELGPHDRELERDAAAERAADERGARDREPVEQRRDVDREAERRALDRRPPEAGQVATDERVPARERGPLRLPDPAVRDPGVDEDDRRAGARPLVPQRHAGLPNQRARRLEPNCSFSATSAADGSRNIPVGFGPERKSTSTRPTRPPPNST